MFNLFCVTLCSFVVVHGFEFGFEEVPLNNFDLIEQTVIEFYTAKNDIFLQNLTTAMYSPYENSLQFGSEPHPIVDLNNVIHYFPKKCIIFLSNFLGFDISPLEIPIIVRRPILAMIQDRFYFPQYKPPKMTWALDSSSGSLTGNQSEVPQGFYTTRNSICLAYPGKKLLEPGHGLFETLRSSQLLQIRVEIQTLELRIESKSVSTHPNPFTHSQPSVGTPSRILVPSSTRLASRHLGHPPKTIF